MQKRFFYLLIMILLVTMARAQQKKAVFILIDGVPADVLEATNTPVIDEISAMGGYTRAHVGGDKGDYNETPTISAPGYMNMITGVWANKHNVWGNGVKNPNYHYWNAFRVVKEVAPEKKIAIFSTWLDNRTKLVGDSKREAGNIQFDYAFDGFELDTINYPHKPDRKFIFDIDEHVSKEAGRYIKTEAPDLSWVYLEFTDDMGHKFGDSPQMTEAVQKADQQIGRIWEALKYRMETFDEDWMIVITTDHGRTAKDGKGHGGQSDRERTTWISTNHADLNGRFSNSETAIADVMPSVLAHLEVQVPDNLRAEMDGISFINDLSIMNAKAKNGAGNITLTWEAVDGAGKVQIYHADANNFAEGKKDKYRLIGTVPVTQQEFSAKLKLKKGVHKLLLKADHNWTNTWIVVD